MFILTKSGWMDEGKILTPKTKKVSKNAYAQPIKWNKESDERLKGSKVKRINGYYFL